MQHFLITRFNIATPWTLDRVNRPTQTEEWLRKRFELFDKYCFPSVRSQSNKDFKWLCFFDANTPQKYIAKIEEYKREFGNFIPCFLTTPEALDFQSTLKRTISEILPTGTTRIITTRLDNDDAIHKDMMGLVRRHVEVSGSNNSIMSFLYGYQYVLRLNLLIRVKYKNNHYLSRVEPANDFSTVMDFAHTSASTLSNIEILGSGKEPFWIEVVHDSNVINNVITSSSARPVLKSVLLSDFGLMTKVSASKAFVGFFTGYVPSYVSRKINSIFKKTK